MNYMNQYFFTTKPVFGVFQGDLKGARAENRFGIRTGAIGIIWPMPPCSPVYFCYRNNKHALTINHKHMKKILKIRVMMPIQLLPLLLVVTMATAQTGSMDKKVAVLPIHYIGTESNEMRYRLQDMVVDYLRRSQVKIQDPVETNALLGRKQIKADDLRDYLPAELATILGVDYVITGRVSQEYAGATNNNRSNTHHDRHQRQISTQSRTTELFNTYIELDIYTSTGENIYSKSRKSILYDVDAYKNGLHYLLKRSPIIK
jgi:hypothetical protein